MPKSFMESVSGLLSLREVERLAMQHLATAERGQSPLAIAVSNIDDLKQVNDQHGYAGGDKLIGVVASRLMEVLPQEFCIGHLLGTNLLVLAPNYSTKQLFSLIENARADLGSQSVELPDSTSANVSVSFGLAMFPTDADSFLELVAKAENQLGRAKQLGKNRVEPCNRTSCYGCNTGMYALE